VDYEVFIHVRAWDFLQARMEIEGSRLQFECESLGKNPHREPDFVDHSEEGDIYGALIGQYAILYRVDHAVKNIYVGDITFADQI